MYKYFNKKQWYMYVLLTLGEGGALYEKDGDATLYTCMYM